MTLLAIDTSSRRRALCVLVDGDGAPVDVRLLGGQRLDRELPAAVAALLRDDLDAVACVLGPGSYTGLRVGIATALGLTHARNLHLHGIAALDVVAMAATQDAGDAIEVLADAGRGAVYVAEYRRVAGAAEPRAPARRVELSDWSPGLSLTAVSFDPIPGTIDVSAAAPHALAAAAIAACRGAPLPRAGLEPIYVSGVGAPARGPRV